MSTVSNGADGVETATTSCSKLDGDGVRLELHHGRHVGGRRTRKTSHALAVVAIYVVFVVGVVVF